MNRELETFLQEIINTNDSEELRRDANALLDSLGSRTFVLMVSDGMTSQLYGPITTATGVEKVRDMRTVFARRLAEHAQPGTVEVRAMEVFSLDVLEATPWGSA